MSRVGRGDDALELQRLPSTVPPAKIAKGRRPDGRRPPLVGGMRGFQFLAGTLRRLTRPSRVRFVLPNVFSDD